MKQKSEGIYTIHMIFHNIQFQFFFPTLFEAGATLVNNKSQRVLWKWSLAVHSSTLPGYPRPAPEKESSYTLISSFITHSKSPCYATCLSLIAWITLTIVELNSRVTRSRINIIHLLNKETESSRNFIMLLSVVLSKCFN